MRDSRVKLPLSPTGGGQNSQIIIVGERDRFEAARQQSRVRGTPSSTRPSPCFPRLRLGSCPSPGGRGVCVQCV